MYSLKPDPVIADCRTDVNELCSGITVVVNALLKVPFLPQLAVTLLLA